MQYALEHIADREAAFNRLAYQEALREAYRRQLLKAGISAGRASRIANERRSFYEDSTGFIHSSFVNH